MEYFLHTTGTIPSGKGFTHFDSTHISWLIAAAVWIFLNAILFRKLNERKRAIWQKTVAWLIVADEVFKIVMLCIGDGYTVGYLPLHLCSINIFLILWHAYRPSALLDNFLYTVCIPGAVAALLFPTWTSLPVANFMHLHSETIHILLVMYPLVLAVNGKMRLSWKMIPKCMGLLVAMAIPIYGINLLLDTNFMFLSSASPGNPLYWFAEHWGSHLLGYPVIISAVLVVMYLPITLYHRRKRQ